MNSRIQIVQPTSWPMPRGYSNGIAAEGRVLFVAGQIGWVDGEFKTHDFVEQFEQALDNVLAVVQAANATAHDIVQMRIYVTHLDDYRNNLKPIGRIWKNRFENHYPAMALVGVSGLVERNALIEIEAIAVLPK